MIYSTLASIVKSEFNPCCPFCSTKLEVWIGGDPPEELQYFCNCVNLTTLYSVSGFIPEGEKFPIVDTIQFITNAHQVSLLFKEKKTIIRSFITNDLLNINELIDCDFNNLHKLQEDINLYIMLS